MKKYFLIFFFAFIFANLIALDVWVLQNRNREKDKISQCDFSRLPSPTAQAVGGQACPKACLDKINEATASVNTEKIESVPVAKTVTVIVTPPATQLKEFYIALGTGTGVGNDWKDIDNTDTKVDLSGFSRIKNVYFEVAGILQNDNVTANVRLYNVTDKQPVWNSEVTINKLKCQTLTSLPISLPAGIRTYRLQVKSTLNATVYVDQARLRIVAE